MKDIIGNYLMDIIIIGTALVSLAIWLAHWNHDAKQEQTYLKGE